MNALLLVAALAITPVDRPADAVAFAFGDLAGNVPQELHPFIRYLWIPPEIAKQDNLYPVSCYGLHMAATQRAEPINPGLVAGGRLIRLYAKDIDPKDPFHFLHTFDSLAEQDGMFHSLANVYVTDFTRVPVGATIEINFSDGTWKPAIFHGLDKGRVRYVINGKPGDTVPYWARFRAVQAGHLGRETLSQLAAATQSECPILDLRFFIVKSLTTIDGGKYYEFRRTPRGKGNKTDLAALRKELGVPEDFESIIKSASRVATSWSGVTGSSRGAVYEAISIGARPADGAGILRSTLDNPKANVREDQDPNASLIDPNVAASEVIYTLPSGLHGFALYNDKEELQDEVPPDIAVDTTIPSSIDGWEIAERRLNSGRSCIVCHAQEDGVRTVRNTVLEKIRSGYVPVTDKELKRRGITAHEAKDILLAMYGADFSVPSERLRDDYARTCFKLTGLEPQPLSAGISKIFNDYLWAPVTARRALWDMGWDVPEEDARLALRTMVGNLKGVFGESLEAQRLTDLLIGVPIQRNVWLRLENETTMRVIEWEDQYETRQAAAEALEAAIAQAKRRGL